MKIYPAILTESMTMLQEQINILQQNPDISTVEIDIIDGYFAETVTVSPLDLVDASFADLSLQLHLMTNEPQDFVFEAIPIKASLPIQSLVGQVEQMSYQTEFLAEIKANGWQAGLALNQHTPVEAIDQASWEKLDIIQLLAVEAGSQGQAFNPYVFEKIAEVQQIIDNLDHPVEVLVDGGVKLSQLPSIHQARADGVIVGSAIWQASDPTQAVNDFLQAV